MLKLTVAVLAMALAGSASAAGWRSLRLEASDEASFAKSVAAFQAKLSPARRYVFELALQDLWIQGAQSAEAQQREYEASEYFQRLHGLGYDEVVKLADPAGETAKARYVAAKARYVAALQLNRPPAPAPRWTPEPAAPIGPHGEQVRGIVDSGPAYQHSLRSMGQ